jgi:hypothetical protein
MESGGGGGFICGTDPPIVASWKSVDKGLSKPQVFSANVSTEQMSSPRDATWPHDSISDREMLSLLNNCAAAAKSHILISEAPASESASDLPPSLDNCEGLRSSAGQDWLSGLTDFMVDESNSKKVFFTTTSGTCTVQLI